mgnify:CR=1 FL=1
MTDTAQACGNCSKAEWQLSAKGNRLRSVPGICTVEFQPPAIPSCYTITMHKTKVWPDMGKDCPTWTAK